MMIVRVAVRSPIMLLVFSLIMAFVINVKIAFIFLALVPILGAGLFILFRLVDPIFTKGIQEVRRYERVYTGRYKRY